MDHRVRFFDKLFDAISDRARDHNGEFEVSRYGNRGLYFSVKRKQPVREAAVNFMGGGAFVHLGSTATALDVVDEQVAIRLTDSATLTVEQWAETMMQHLMKAEPAQAAAATAGSASPKSAAKGKKGKK